MKKHDTIIADKAYDIDELRDYWAQKKNSKHVSLRNPITCAQLHTKNEVYKKRHRVENYFLRAKRNRRLGTRYEKTAIMFFAFLTLFTIMDYIIHRPASTP